jgi:hypothetical protein
MEILKITDTDNKLEIVKGKLTPFAEMYGVTFSDDWGINIKSGNYYYTFSVKKLNEIVDTDTSITIRSISYTLIFFKHVNHLVPIIF